jgi:hypothetical protein
MAATRSKCEGVSEGGSEGVRDRDVCVCVCVCECECEYASE